MTHTAKKTVKATVISTLALVASAVSFSASAASKNELQVCSTTQFENGIYSSVYGLSCGGDNLEEGRIAVTHDGKVAVSIQGALADPFNLYEVYWMPIGGDPSSSAGQLIKVGNFITDCDGNSRMLLKDLERASDLANSPVDITTKVDAHSAGTFWVYSRGPYAHTDRGDCRPTYFNTVVSDSDTDPANDFANPEVNTDSDLVQFISGY